jgi:hypothetical protein
MITLGPGQYKHSIIRLSPCSFNPNSPVTEPYLNIFKSIVSLKYDKFAKLGKERKVLCQIAGSFQL